MPGLVDNCNGAVGGGTGSVGKLPSAASMHSFLQLHKSAGKETKVNKKKEKHFTEMSNSTTLGPCNVLSKYLLTYVLRGSK